MGTVIEVAARMTVPVALAVAGICLVVLALLTGPQAARLVRHGTPPPRPRRFWLTLLVAREIGTAGADDRERRARGRAAERSVQARARAQAGAERAGRRAA